MLYEFDLNLKKMQQHLGGEKNQGVADVWGPFHNYLGR